MKIIGKLKSLQNKKLHYVDIGAGSPGAKEPWLSYRPLIKTISFEADRERVRALAAKDNPDETVIHAALYSCETEKMLRITHQPSAISMLQPNMELRNKFPESGYYEIFKEIPIACKTLDSFNLDTDFVKIIVNGVEDHVLKGGKKTLEQAVGLQIAVEFDTLFQGESLFCKINELVNSLGLQLQDIEKHYMKYTEGVGYGHPKGRLVFGDVLYFRPPEQVVEMSEDKIIAAIIMGAIYGYSDYPLRIARMKGWLKVERIIKRHFKRWADRFRYRGNQWRHNGNPLGARK